VGIKWVRLTTQDSRPMTGFREHD